MPTKPQRELSPEEALLSVLQYPLRRELLKDLEEVREVLDRLGESSFKGRRY